MPRCIRESSSLLAIAAEQLTLARRILSPQPDGREIGVEDILRLATVTIELHRKLSSGTPFPSVWLGGTLRARGELAHPS